jgi:hypothetical protein
MHFRNGNRWQLQGSQTMWIRFTPNKRSNGTKSPCHIFCRKRKSCAKATRPLNSDVRPPMSYRPSISIILVLGMSSQGYAACVQESYSIEDEFARSTIVALGTVTSSEAAPESLPHYDGINYKVSLTSIYQGKAEASVELFSENSTGRFPMEIGQEYVLFIYESFGRNFVDNCGNSGLAEDKESVIETIRNLTR